MSHGQRSTFSCRKKAISQSNYNLIHATINTRTRYGNLTHVSDSCRQQFCIQNCCQTAEDIGTLQLTLKYDTIDGYYSTDSLSLVIALSNGTIVNPYDVPFSHNTCDTERQTTDDTSYPRLDVTVGQKLTRFG